MDVYDAITKRASVRRFTEEDVPDDTVKRLLAAACRAPTAGNIQPWRFFVVRDAKVREGLAEAAFGQAYVAGAPVVVVFCADLDASASGYGARGESLYSIQDTAAAVENLLLGVVAEGLGACWVGAFNEAKAAEVLGLPGRVRPLALVPIGHPAGEPHRTGRIPFEKLTKYL